MYFFLVFGLDLGFALLILHSYPRSEYRTTRRAFLFGLASFIPLWIVARILGAIVPPAYGSFLLTFHEWADRLLPYSLLPALAYLVFYRKGEHLPFGAAQRRQTAFYVGALSPVGLCEAAWIWGSPNFYSLFLLPFLLGAICLFMPKAAMAAYDSYGRNLAAIVAASLALSFAASVCPFLFLARLWPLAILVVAAAGAGAWLLAFPELQRRPPLPFDEVIG